MNPKQERLTTALVEVLEIVNNENFSIGDTVASKLLDDVDNIYFDLVTHMHYTNQEVGK